MKEKIAHAWQRCGGKYIVVIILGVLFVGFLDQNSIWAHFRYKQHIAELQAEIDAYNESYHRDSNIINQLQTNPKAIERVARERYFMKAPDEDIFILSDDLQPTSTPTTDETAQ